MRLDKLDNLNDDAKQFYKIGWKKEIWKKKIKGCLKFSQSKMTNWYLSNEKKLPFFMIVLVEEYSLGRVVYLGRVAFNTKQTKGRGF